MDEIESFQSEEDIAAEGEVSREYSYAYLASAQSK